MPGRSDHTTLRALRVIWWRPVLRRYIGAYATFSLAEWSTWIAALVYAFDRGGATAAGVVAFVMLIPAAVFAPFASALGDHIPRERLAFAGLAAQACAMAATGLAMLADLPSIVVYAAATAATALVTITRPAHFSLLPRLSRSTAELTAANATTAVVEGSAAVLSPAVAALVLALASPGAVWLLMAVVVGLGSLLITPTRSTSSDDEPMTMAGGDLIRSSIEGFQIIVKQREPRVLVGLAGMVTVIEGALDVLIVALAIDAFGRGDGAVGLLNTALGVGALIGALASAGLVGRRRLAPAVLVGGLLLGLGVMTAGLTTIFGVAMLGMLVAGSGLSFGQTAERTLLQRLVDDRVLTRVFGAIEGSKTLGLAIGALIAPALIAMLDERAATVIVGALLPAILLLRGRRLLSLDRTAHVPERSLELLTAIPMFAELTPPVIERLAAELEPSEISAGQVIIAEGDAGDRFYVIDTGLVGVSRQDRHVAELGGGDFFGEIALLRDIPRTATVTAVGDCVVRTLRRDDFLEAVTGRPRARAAAHDGAQTRLDELPDGGED